MASHDTNPSSPPLLKSIVRSLSRTTIPAALGSHCPSVRRVATDWLLNRLPPEEVEQILLHGLKADDRMRLGVLQVLKHPGYEVTEPLHRSVMLLIDDNNDAVRREAVDVIVRRWPEDAGRVLAAQRCRMDYESLRILCRADDSRLVPALMEAFGFPHKNPPPPIGFPLTPVWLADWHPLYPDPAEWLIRECGYCESPVTPDVIDMLSLGFSFVVPQMTASGPADEWLDRMRMLSWRLLPDAADLSLRDGSPLDLDNPIDTALFLSAVRETDRIQFRECRMAPPAPSARVPVEPSPVCFHANARLLKRMFLADARVMASELAVPEDRIGEFTLDHARCLLETDFERRAGADRRLRTEWQMRRAFGYPAGKVDPALPLGSRNSRQPGISDRRPVANPIRRDLRSPVPAVLKPPEARRLVIGEFVPATNDSSLSPGAQSVCRLLELAGMDPSKVARWLKDCERRWARILVPIGIELQIPAIDPNLFGPWKDALPFLGIPSPHRPEFGGMLEAAFRPAKSFHAMVLAPPLLHRLGVIPQAPPQDIAMHISLQGHLGPASRVIAFPQLFIHPSQRLRNRSDASMTRVMSKGLVHFNRDLERVEETPIPTEAETVRTEFRVFRVFSDAVESGTGIAPSYIDDILATHLIGSAILSRCTECRRLTQAYERELDSVVEALPPEFSRLLHADFDEPTGDPHDESLLQQLPIFRAWSDVRRIVRERNQSAELDQCFSGLRARHFKSLVDHVAGDHRVDLSGDLAELADWSGKFAGSGTA